MTLVQAVSREERIADYFRTARERYEIHLKKAARLPPPWTDDPTFRDFRFCNVFREDDKTTAWFRRNLRNPLSLGSVTRVTFATIAFRWFNRIETGETIRHLLLSGPGGWDPDEVRSLLRDVKPLTNAAYMIKTPAGKNKLEGLLECIDNAVEWLNHQPDLPWRTIQSCHRALTKLPYMGRFMAYEVATDLRHTRACWATDAMLWASAGPGCARGLSWLLEARPDAVKYSSARGQAQLLRFMRELLEASRKEEHWPAHWPAWEMREVEHWACEHWKYIRHRVLGQNPKQRYSGGHS